MEAQEVLDLLHNAPRGFAGRPSRHLVEAGIAELFDPLHAAWCLHAELVEVSSPWCHTELRALAETHGSVSPAAAAALVAVDVGDFGSLGAARQRVVAARATGTRVAVVVAVGPLGLHQSRVVSNTELEHLAEEVSAVQPAFFDLTKDASPASQALYLELLLDVLTIRLAWQKRCGGPPKHVAGPAGQQRPARRPNPRTACGLGQPLASTELSNGRRSTAVEAAVHKRQPLRGFTGRERSADDCPTRAGFKSLPMRRSPGQRKPKGVGSEAPMKTFDPRQGSSQFGPTHAAERAAARAMEHPSEERKDVEGEALETIEQAIHDHGAAESVVSLASLTQSAASLHRAPVFEEPSRLLFEVDLEVGDGQVVPIQVHTDDDLEALAEAAAKEHSLGEIGQRRVWRFLQKVAKQVAYAK